MIYQTNMKYNASSWCLGLPSLIKLQLILSIYSIMNEVVHYKQHIQKSSDDALVLFYNLP